MYKDPSDIAPRNRRSAVLPRKLLAATALAVFFVSMVVMSIGSAFLGSAPTAVVGDIMGGRQGGSVVATFQMVSDIGAVIGPLLGGLLLDLYGFEWAFAFGAGISALALVFVLLMPETLRSRAKA